MNGPVVHVFAGPTITSEEVIALVPGARVHPPVAHGDLLRLGAGAGDVVVVVDGYYHQAAPVRHKEILQLAADGVHVVGCASMGALRAAELHGFGMVGHGRVFEMYRSGRIDADDEVAVAHARAGDYRASNIPLVNIRVALEEAHLAGVLTGAEADRLLATAVGLHYTDRSWRAMQAVDARHGNDAEVHDRLAGFLAEHPEHREAKHADAVDTLRRLAELVAEPAPAVPDPSWHNERVFNWLVEFSGREVDGRWVSDGDVLRHHQLYSPELPGIWEQLALTGLGADGGGTADPEQGAAEVFARHRDAPVEVAVLDAWLTPAERATLSPDRARLRVLVRSFKPVRALHDLRTFAPHLLDDTEVHARVARSRRLNDEVRWRQVERLVERLPARLLEEHLGRLWSVPGGDAAALLAAARDRGFPTVAAATAAARLHFLNDDAHDGGRITRRWSTAR